MSIEAEQQEPVAWQVEVFIQGVWSPTGNPQRNKDRAEGLASNPSIPKECQRIVELYTSPPQRQPMTDEEILHLVDTHVGAPSMAYPLDNSDWVNFSRAIEAKLKEKNT